MGTDKHDPLQTLPWPTGTLPQELIMGSSSPWHGKQSTRARIRPRVSWILI